MNSDLYENKKFYDNQMLIKPINTVLTYAIKEFNRDLSYIDLEEIDARCSNLTNVKLPLDKNAFQKVSKKDMSNVIFPDTDLSSYDFTGVKISNAAFPKNCRLPNDRDLFQRIESKSIFGAALPEGNYASYDFNGVYAPNVIYTKNSILPKNYTQVVRDKSIYYTTLPEMDYSDFDFTETHMEGCKFTKYSKLPETPNLFRMVKRKSIYGVILPAMSLKNYDFTGVYIAEADFSSCYDFPKDKDFFQKLKIKDISNVNFPENFNFSKYNLRDLECYSIEFKEDMNVCNRNLLHIISNFTGINPTTSILKYLHLYYLEEFIDKPEGSEFLIQNAEKLTVYQKIIVSNKTNFKELI